MKSREVNIYLSEAFTAQVDRAAKSAGLTRSSFIKAKLRATLVADDGRLCGVAESADLRNAELNLVRRIDRLERRLDEHVERIEKRVATARRGGRTDHVVHRPRVARNRAG